MMAQPTLDQNQFQNLLNSFYELNCPEDLLVKFREKAWDHFLELGLPNRSNDVFRYIKLRNLYSKALSLAKKLPITKDIVEKNLLPECRNSTLVFVNGHFSKEFSRLENIDQVGVYPLPEAAKAFSALFNNQLSLSIKEETDPFVVLNTSLHPLGAFIYIGPKQRVGHPIQILNIFACPENMLLLPRLQVFAGKESQADFYSTHAFLEESQAFVNQSTQFTLEEAAKVTYTQVSTEQSDQTWFFDSTRAHLKRDSHFKTLAITNGGGTVRYDYKATLAGENAEALLNGVWMLNDRNEAHVHVLMEHQAPHCRSMQLYKGVLNDVSQSSFEGKILVRQAAQKTEAFQLNNNLLLSEGAITNSKPNLEIFADDVKASHGATVGQLDQEQLFYMKTRGFTHEQAQNLLVYGYCQEVIQQITLPSLLEKVSQQAQNYVLKRI